MGIHMLGTPERKETEYNMTFGLLAGLAIIMVVAGHLGYEIMTFGGLFPYYSFHVPLFLFVSGYFYQGSAEEHPLPYLKKKIRRLLVPYFIWNLLYGLFAWLLRAKGFCMGEEIGIRTLFLSPFLHGYQFIYNYAAWFVPVLFVIEVMNLFMRILTGRVLQMLPQRKRTEAGGRTIDGEPREPVALEWFYLCGSLLVGMAVVCLAIGGHVWGDYKAPGRILFLYPCFQMGQVYRRKLERHDTIGNLPYFAVLLSVQVILHLCCNGLAFSSVWCTGFANGPVIPYVTIVSGIAFWLRIAKVLTPVAKSGRLIRYMGQHTYTVMMHHVLVFLLIKMILAGVAACTDFCGDFDLGQFYTNIDYIYLVNGAEHFKMVYLAAGVMLPLGVRYLGECVIRKRKARPV